MTLTVVPAAETRSWKFFGRAAFSDHDHIHSSCQHDHVSTGRARTVATTAME
ncbi:hypothetical protein IG631_14690 [Alternaria alternata]|nr:hypothetical protein IG631_14690 [Alternaria alternata]